MSNTTGFYPSLKVDTAAAGGVSNAGATLLVETARKTGLDQAVSTTLGRWRRPTAIHDPGKILCDLAVAVAFGSDCLADIATVRADPGVVRLVVSDPTVSRLIDTLATDADKTLAAGTPPAPQSVPQRGNLSATTPPATTSVPTTR